MKSLKTFLLKKKIQSDRPTYKDRNTNLNMNHVYYLKKSVKHYRV